MSAELTFADLWLRSSLRNAIEENDKDRKRKIAKGIERVPVRAMMQQAQYIDEVLLPRIEKNRGKDADYKFFAEVFNSLLWAVCLADRNDYMEMRHAKNSLLLEFFQGHAEKLERQMNKYTALEDLFLTSGLDTMAEGMGERARALLEQKGEWQKVSR